MKDLCLALIALLGAAHASHAQAQGRDHDGFMLRFTVGGAYGSVTEEVEGFDAEISGAGVMLGIDVGGSPTDNLVLHGRFSGFVMSSPTAKINGMSFETRDDSSMSMFLFAPAVTYYVMPANLYFTGAVGMAVLTGEAGDRTFSTDPGLGLNLDVGWEFWLGRQASWAMGPALRFFYASVPDDVESGEAPTVNAVGGGAMFTATFQ